MNFQEINTTRGINHPEETRSKDKNNFRYEKTKDCYNLKTSPSHKRRLNIKQSRSRTRAKKRHKSKFSRSRDRGKERIDYPKYKKDRRDKSTRRKELSNQKCVKRTRFHYSKDEDLLYSSNCNKENINPMSQRSIHCNLDDEISQQSSPDFAKNKSYHLDINNVTSRGDSNFKCEYKFEDFIFLNSISEPPLNGKSKTKLPFNHRTSCNFNFDKKTLSLIEKINSLLRKENDTASLQSSLWTLINQQTFHQLKGALLHYASLCKREDNDDEEVVEVLNLTSDCIEIISSNERSLGGECVNTNMDSIHSVDLKNEQGIFVPPSELVTTSMSSLRTIRHNKGKKGLALKMI